jgi:glyoxylase-like metal-dependent hydrolase (beta-lactamase superfamily II)
MSEHPLPPIRVETFVVGEFEANCFVVSAPKGQCLVVDPGAEATRIVPFLEKNNLSVAAYLLSHGHPDHVAALWDMNRIHPAPYAMHPADASWAFSEANQMPPFYAAPRRPRAPFRSLDAIRDLHEAGLRVTVLATPGHSPGSVCFFLEEHGLLFSGDTLFCGSIGRTDLPGGNLPNMQASLRTIAALPPSTLVYPGHGPPTDIATELRNNFFLHSL